MDSTHVFSASDPGWASSVEFASIQPSQGATENLEFKPGSEAEILFFVAALSSASGNPGPVDATLLVTDERGAYTESRPGGDAFVSDKLVIVPRPAAGHWRLEITAGVFPYAVHAMAFHPWHGPMSAVTPSGPGKSSFKCGICKSTAKGLAVAIAAACTYAVVPSAVLTSVAAFLGASITASSPVAVGGSAAAAAFIASCFGDTVTVIAEKLCLAVRLCP